MIYRDEIRILAELGTFTQTDFARETETSPQWASTVFEQLVRGKYIHRVRVGHSWLYALTERGTRFVSKMPAIDPEERCLMLSLDGISPEPGLCGGCCPDWNSSHMNYVPLEPGGMIGAWECPHCGSRYPVAVYNPH